MRYALLITTALLFAGCATPRHRYQSLASFEPEAKASVERMEWLVNSDDGTDPIAKCQKKKGDKRERCLDDAREVIAARLHIKYPLSDQMSVKNYFLAHKQERIDLDRDKFKKAIPGASDDIIESLIAVSYYEAICRESQWRQLTLARYREHVESIDAYNRWATEKDARDAQAWSSVSQSLNSAAQQSQLQRIEDNQNHIRWQQQNDQYQRNGGIMPVFH